MIWLFRGYLMKIIKKRKLIDDFYSLDFIVKGF